MAERIRAHDWSATPLGPIESWPQSLRTAVDLVLAGGFPMMLLWGPQHIVCAFNEGFRALLDDEASALGRPFLELYPQARSTIEPQLRRVLAGETLLGHDASFTLTRSGRQDRVWLDYCYSPVRNETGAVAGVLGTAIETTERHEAEVALRESESRYRALFESLDEGFCVMEMVPGETEGAVDFRCLLANRAFEAHAGARSLVGRTLREIFPELPPSCANAFREVALTGEPKRSIHRTVSSDRWFDVYAFRIGNPAARQIALLFNDISVRRRMEDALRRNSEQLTQAMHVARVGVFDHDHRTGEVVASPLLRQMHEFNDDVLSVPGHVMQQLHPEDRELYRETLRRAHDPAGDGFGACEYRIILRDGSVRWISLRSQTFFEGEGEARRPVRTIGAEHDITERKLVEERLQEADRKKDQFLAMLAHELRNPLAPIRNALQILRTPTAGESQRQWCWAVIERQIQQMTRLLDDLLDVSRITRGTLELRRQPVSLHEAVGSAIETARPLIDSKRHQLDLQLPAQPVYVNADPARMTQILGNLLTNAAKYTDPGGRIVIGGRREGAEVVIWVRDNGIGMTREQLAQIFRPFVQAPDAAARAEGGLGIGLAIAQGLVELHGGRIEVHSEGRGRGSEFVVRLPAG